MEKTSIISVGDTITTKKYGRWTVAAVADDGFITLVKIRLGKITESFKVRVDKLFS